MKIKAIALALLAFVLPASAQRITMTVTVTNRAVTSNSFTANGSVRVFTNVTGTLTIATNLTSINATKTNLFNQIAAFPFTGVALADGTGSADTGTNAFRLLGSFGGALSGSITGAWGYVTLATQSGPSTFTMLYPVANIIGETNRTNQSSDMVSALNSYPTNFAATNASWLSNYLSKGAHSNQVVTSPVRFTGNLSADKELRATNGFTSGLTNINSVSSNHVNYGNAIRSEGPGANSFQAGSNATATGTRAVALGNSASSSATDGFAAGTIATNSSTGGTTVGNQSLVNGDYGAAFAFQSTATNFGSAYGAGSVASGLGSSAFGHAAEAQAEESAAFGADSLATAYASGAFQGTATAVFAKAFGGNANHSNSAAFGTLDHLGNGTATTTTNQIILGTANHHVWIPGFLRTVLGASNFLTTASSTNILRGSMSYPRFDVTTLANGNNIAVPFGTNRYIRLGGTVTASPTICGIVGGATTGGTDGQEFEVHNDLGYAVTFAQNTVDPVPANRIETQDGNDVSIANNGAIRLIYSGNDSRWHIADTYPVTASATNALYSLQTNGVSVTTALTNLNVISGSGVDIRATNSSGSVGIRFSLEDSTNSIPIRHVSAKLPTTNMAVIDQSRQLSRVVFYRTNGAGANVDLSAIYDGLFAPVDYKTNTLTVHIASDILSTNGPNSSNVLWQASIFRDNTAGGGVSTNDADLGPFSAGSSTLTTTWAASDTGTNKAQITSILITNCTLAAGEPFALKIERLNSNSGDTAVVPAGLRALRLEYRRQ